MTKFIKVCLNFFEGVFRLKPLQSDLGGLFLNYLFAINKYLDNYIKILLINNIGAKIVQSVYFLLLR